MTDSKISKNASAKNWRVFLIQEEKITEEMRSRFCALSLELIGISTADALSLSESRELDFSFSVGVIRVESATQDILLLIERLSRMRIPLILLSNCRYLDRFLQAIWSVKVVLYGHVNVDLLIGRCLVHMPGRGR